MSEVNKSQLSGHISQLGLREKIQIYVPQLYTFSDGIPKSDKVSSKSDKVNDKCEENKQKNPATGSSCIGRTRGLARGR
jgi:hypothetical protein